MCKLSIEAFQKQLEKEQSDYHLVSEKDAQDIRFQFIGPFMGETVIWHAQLLTLDTYNQVQKCQLNSQQMDIQALSAGHYKIQIILKLPRLNSASINMAIKMVRQYKRLKLGLHHWN